MSLNDTGQHSFDIDFETFDNLCAADDVGLADLFDDHPETSLPIDPDLTEPTHEIHGNDKSVAILSPPKACSSNLRPASASRRHKHTHKEVVDPLVGNDLPINSFEMLNEDQQDQVLPGYEDIQRRYSEKARRSGTANDYRTQLELFAGRDTTSPTSSSQAARRRQGGSAKSKRKTNVSGPVEEDGAAQSGPFTGAETSKLEEYREAYCEENAISEWKFNELVQAKVRDKPKAPGMWLGMYELLPYRKKQSIQRFCRRRFHNFEARGAWTAEDDELLGKAVEEKGKSWVAVGQIMGRSQEDVRDRYRNYHVNAEHRNKEAWTDLEIRNLVRAVLECIQYMKQERVRLWQASYEGRDLPDMPPELQQDEDDLKLINWQSVSDRMHGTRSRLQCSFKWAHISDKDRQRFMNEITASRRGRASKPREKKVAKNPWRAKKPCGEPN